MGTMRPNKYDATIMCENFRRVTKHFSSETGPLTWLPHLTFYAKILYLLMVVVAGALCNRDQIYLYSKCASRYVGITPDGKLLAYDNTGDGQPHEIITISHHMDSFAFDRPNDQLFRLTLFLEKNQTYLCYTKKWRLVTMKNLHESCYFYETLENGWFQYRSAMNEKIFLGFTANGRPVRHKAPLINTECYNFQKDVVHNKTVKNHPQQHKNRRKKGRKKQQQLANARRRHGLSNIKKLLYTTTTSTTTTTTTPKYSTAIDDGSNSKESDLQLFTDYMYDDFWNLTKKQKVIPKKFTNINSGLLPKFRHANGKHHRNKHLPPV